MAFRSSSYVSLLLALLLAIPTPLRAVDDTRKKDSVEASEPAHQEAHPQTSPPAQPQRRPVARWMRGQFSLKCLMGLTALVALGVGTPIYWEREMARSRYEELLQYTQSPYDRTKPSFERLKALMAFPLGTARQGSPMQEWILRFDPHPVIRKYVIDELPSGRGPAAYVAARELLGPNALKGYDANDPAGKRLDALRAAVGRGLTADDRKMLELAAIFEEDSDLKDNIQAMLLAPTLLSKVANSKTPFEFWVLEAADIADRSDPAIDAELRALWSYWKEHSGHIKMGSLDGAKWKPAHRVILRRLFEKDSDDLFKHALMSGLKKSNFGGQAIDEMLSSVIDSPDPRVRANALRALRALDHGTIWGPSRISESKLVAALSDAVLNPIDEGMRMNAINVLDRIAMPKEGLPPGLAGILAHTAEKGEVWDQSGALRLLRYVPDAGPEETQAIERILTACADGRYKGYRIAGLPQSESVVQIVGSNATTNFMGTDPIGNVENAWASLLHNQPTKENAERVLDYVESTSMLGLSPPIDELGKHPELVSLVKGRVAAKAAESIRKSEWLLDFYLGVLAQEQMPADVEELLVADIQDRRRYSDIFQLMPAGKAVPLLLRALKKPTAAKPRGANAVVEAISQKNSNLATREALSSVGAHLRSHGLAVLSPDFLEKYLDALGPKSGREFIKQHWDKLEDRTLELGFDPDPTEYYGSNWRQQGDLKGYQTVRDIWMLHGMTSENYAELISHFEKYGLDRVADWAFCRYLATAGEDAEKEAIRRWDAIMKNTTSALDKADAIKHLKAKHDIP